MGWEGKEGVKDDAGFWLEPQKRGLPLTQMGGLREGQGYPGADIGP